MSGLGYACPHGERDTIRSHFPKNSVAVVLQELSDEVHVYLPGQDMEFAVERNDTANVNVYETGKGYDNLICNICFVLKSEVNLRSIRQTRKESKPDAHLVENVGKELKVARCPAVNARKPSGRNRLKALYGDVQFAVRWESWA